jgi:hypothetical protein
MAARLGDDDEESAAVGRALYSGIVSGDSWQITEASPAIVRDTLADALTFVSELVTHGRLRVRSDLERQAFETAAADFSPEDGSLVWDGDTVRLAQRDERTLLLLAVPVFQARFSGQWPADTVAAW